LPRKPNRRANGEGTIYKRSNGRFLAIVSFTDTNGKTRRRTKTARSKADANILLRQMLDERDRGNFAAASSMTVGEYLRHWIETDIHQERAANTYEDYMSSIRNQLEPGLGRVKLSNLTTFKVKTFFSELKKSGLGARTRLKAYIVLKSAMKQAVILGEISKNPCEGVPRPKHSPKRVQPFSLEETKSLIAESEGDHFEAVLQVAFSTGMRQGEIFGLPWDAVDLNRGFLRVQQQLLEPKGGPQLSDKLKTPTSYRQIELTPRCIESLIEHRKRQVAEQGRCDLVFTNSIGGFIYKSNFANRFWKPVQKMCEVAPRGFHQTRHTYATLQLSSGCPVHIVASVMGHKDPTTLLKTYAHILDGDQSRIQNNIASILG